jgi:hypothetical protein
MDAKHLRRAPAVVKQAARKPSSTPRAHRSDLLAAAVSKHGLPAVEVLLDLVEAEAGDLRVNARLRRLVELDQAEFTDAVGLIRGAAR